MRKPDGKKKRCSRSVLGLHELSGMQKYYGYIDICHPPACSTHFKPIDLVGFYIRIVYCILYEIIVEGQDSDVIRRDRAFDQIGQAGRIRGHAESVFQDTITLWRGEYV